MSTRRSTDVNAMLYKRHEPAGQFCKHFGFGLYSSLLKYQPEMNIFAKSVAPNNVAPNRQIQIHTFVKKKKKKIKFVLVFDDSEPYRLQLLSLQIYISFPTCNNSPVQIQRWRLQKLEG